MGKKDQDCTLQQHKVLLIQDGIITVTHDHSDTGDAIPIIASLLLDSEITSTYIAGVNLFECMARLNTLMQSIPGWRMRFTNRRRYAFTKGGQRFVTGRFFADYFCIDERTSKKNRTPRKRFDVINLDLIRDKPPHDSHSQLQMALAILELCDNRGIKFKGTRGGIGSSLLKASPFWTPDRRAAPKFINDIARPYLPGNFYSLSHKIDKRSIKSIKHCYYVDQTSAHHNIVKSISLPFPGALHARGNWRDRKEIWLSPNSSAGRNLLSGVHSGLLLCKLQIGTIPPTERHLYPQWAIEKNGSHYVYLWTPELRLLDDRRLQLEFITASFTATTDDLALSEYAEFSLREICVNPERANYKKASLLAAYGMLAFNSAGKRIFRYWGGNATKQRCEIPVAGFVGESVIHIPDHVQLSTVNVVARGVIESETRVRSIEYARELTQCGYHVPQIYADGLLIETDSLPFIRDGWRVSHSLTNVHIPRSNAIISDQVIKLPGVAGSQLDRQWEQSREDSLRVLPSRRAIPDLVIV
jgi:hypothetical protein